MAQKKIKKNPRSPPTPSTASDAPDRQAVVGRSSRLDTLTRDSDIKQSKFWGFFNLCYVVAMFFLIICPLQRYYAHGEFFEKSLAVSMFSNIYLLISIWSTCSLIFSSSYLSLKLCLLGHLSPATVKWSQMVIQISLVGAIGSITYTNRWPIIPGFFVLSVGLIHAMKMHSYTITNLEMMAAVGTPDGDLSFPKNISISNFVRFLFCPVLVYSPSLPISPAPFRWSYFSLKLLLMFGDMMIMYQLLTSYVIPTVLESHREPLIYTCAKLIVPLLFMDLLVFFLLFECICNLFAEVTFYPDREFYNDWWNSTTWDEYARKWNRPVHEFLLRHIYLESRKQLKLSKRDAGVATFLISAMLHEMCMIVCFRIIRFYLFGLMMLQIPLIALGRFHKGTTLGNLIFWMGMTLGVPLLGVCYGREWAASIAGQRQNFEIFRFW